MTHPRPPYTSDAHAGSRAPVYVEEPLCVQPNEGIDLRIRSLAGGPLFTPLRQTSETGVSRVVRLYRRSALTWTLVHDATLEETFASPDAYPAFADLDAVEVTTAETERRRWTWRDTATIGGLVASAVIALSRFILIARP